MFRLMYDALYRMNIGCDFVDSSSDNMEDYSMLVIPPLYATSDDLLHRLNNYVKNGGHIVYAFRSGFSDENVKVRSTHQPGIIGEACGIYYNQFVSANNVTLKVSQFGLDNEKNSLTTWVELITPTTAEVLAYYDHTYYGKYAAITQNSYGKGVATYIGCLPRSEVMEKVMECAIRKAGLWGADQEIVFPLITKTGINSNGNAVHFYFNYSSDLHSIKYPYSDGMELLGEKQISCKDNMDIDPWGAIIIEES